MARLRHIGQKYVSRLKGGRTELEQTETRARPEAPVAALADRSRWRSRRSAKRRAERAEAETTLARQPLAELRVAPPERDGGARRRKAGSRALIEKPSVKLDEHQGAADGLPHAEDDSDSRDDNDDSQH